MLESFCARLGTEECEIAHAAQALLANAPVDAILTQAFQLEPLPLFALGVRAARCLLALPRGELLSARQLLLAALGVVALTVVLVHGTALFGAIAQRAGHPVFGQLTPAAEPTSLNALRGLALQLPAHFDPFAAVAQALGEGIGGRAPAPAAPGDEPGEQQ
jgi:hypothetical protein